MRIIHVGLACSSLEKAEKFYGELLGLKRSELKTIDQATARTLFGQDKEITYFSYFNESLSLELFLMKQQAVPLPAPAHVSLEVENLEELLKRSVSSGVMVKTLFRGEKRIVFISDFDGNLFEIKEARSAGQA